MVPKKTKTKKTTTAKTKQPLPKPVRYWEGVGRRKTSVARVRIFQQSGKDKGPAANEHANIAVNKKPYQSYFPIFDDQLKIMAPFQKLGLEGRFGATAVVKGGGARSQAEAVRHGAARALLKFNPEFRKVLSQLGLLRRDPRMRERKKFGLKRARKAPQWAKR